MTPGLIVWLAAAMVAFIGGNTVLRAYVTSAHWPTLIAALTFSAKNTTSFEIDAK